MNIFKPKLKLIKGTRFVSFLFIGTSVLIAAGILIAANMYYNIDTGEIVMEEIQRTTGLIRALGGVIIGGTSTSTLPAGVALEIATSSDVLLSGVGQLLRFSGGTANYVGFRATTTLTTTTVYTWPSVYGSTGQALITTEDGTLSWSTPAGMGTITTVGDISGVVSGGDAFTAGVPGEYLWFGQDAGNRGQLTVATLPGTATTWTLPNLTGTIALQAESNLSVSGGVVFADSLGRLIQDGNFSYATTSRTLSLGTASAANGILRLYGGTSGYTEFQAAASGANLSYTWPDSIPSADRLLATDATGNLFWRDLSEVEGVGGQGSINQVAFWTSTSSIDGSANFTWVDSRLTLGSTAGLVTPLIEYAGELMIQTTGSGNDIVLYPGSGIVKLGTSTYIETASGYKIGATGTEVLREMIPILGFDLPVRTATSGMVQISRTIDNYPVSSCTDGTSRLHKLVIRYGSAGTTTWQVATSSTGYTSFDLPPTNSTTTGTVHTATTSIPTPAGACTGWIQNSATDDWWVRVNPGGNDTMIYQIFLAAYDQIQ